LTFVKKVKKKKPSSLPRGFEKPFSFQAEEVPERGNLMIV